MQIRLIAMIVLSSAANATPAFAQRLDANAGQYGAQYGAPLPAAPQAISTSGALSPARVQPVAVPQVQTVQGPPAHTLNQVPQGPRASRWGGQINGRWEGGYRAPGGWAAYRRPVRGWRVPNYWIGSNFFIDDYAYFGLATPPRGYRWIRYYDDAVMIDDRGRVYDSVSNIGWDRYEGAYASGPNGGYQGYYSAPGRWEGTYSGTWTQAPQPVQGPPPVVTYQQPQVTQVPAGGYYQTYSAGGYASGVTVNGQFYPAGPPGTVSTVTIQSAPVVTTTVTEYITETRYVAAKRKVYRKPARKVYRKPRCCCR
ncbi:MAG: RcnB family protein [Sphingomonas sp.]|uniref:RcnB family protein n=1 Tax=Sphingomonas sp. TaxID=28214 RepID=UPI000DB63B65|nr:RcnB family protein [Sphingomonas sp.]PZP09104.1 MAG: hypothetical protein DI607_12715 [Sphingomonas hengshuiensis]